MTQIPIPPHSAGRRKDIDYSSNECFSQIIDISNYSYPENDERTLRYSKTFRKCLKD